MTVSDCRLCSVQILWARLEQLHLVMGRYPGRKCIGRDPVNRFSSATIHTHIGLRLCAVMYRFTLTKLMVSITGGINVVMYSIWNFILLLITRWNVFCVCVRWNIAFDSHLRRWCGHRSATCRLVNFLTSNNVFIYITNIPGSLLFGCWKLLRLIALIYFRETEPVAL